MRQRRVAVCCFRATALLFLGLGAGLLPAATTITLTDQPLVLSAMRFGINLGPGVSYYDDRQLMKEIVYRNPGFEGLVYGSIVRCATGTATACIDDNPAAVWPGGFWNGSAFEVISGSARGRTGVIASSTAPASGQGATLHLSGPGSPLSAGAFVILRRIDPSNDATAGWLPMSGGGGSVTGETADLAPDAAGRQCARLSASNVGQTASLSTIFDTTAGMTFLQFKGSYRLTFKARGVGGDHRLTITLRRNAPAGTTLLNRTIVLGSSWGNHVIDFSAAESNAIGGVQLQFGVAQSAALLDEVSLTQIDGDVGNPTRFKDPVVAALRTLRPGLLRYMAFQLGDSLENQLAPPMARLRTGFRSTNLSGEEFQWGLHEFLELAEHIGAEPWFNMPITFSAADVRGLIEYLVGDSSTPFGARRATRGRAQPWTDAFTRIHLEFGNESWNRGQRGATIEDAAVYGSRGSELFAVARGATGFSMEKFNLVLGGWAAMPQHTRATHDASTAHDAIAVAPYFAGHIDSFATNEDLFGPLFAETEMLSQTGFMRQTYTSLQSSSKVVPLAVYEVNLHTTDGSISQSALDSFTPSIGAGLAVADHMLSMLRHLGIRNQLLYSLSGYRFLRSDGKYARLWGSVCDFGLTDRKRPQFLALRLVNGAIGGTLVETVHSGDDPTWNQPLVNTIQYPNARFLRSYAFVNGSSRSLIVFNVHRTSSLEILLAGSGAPKGSVTMERLTAPAITDTNENSERVVVSTTSLPSATSLVLPPYSMTVLRWQEKGRRRAVTPR